MTVTMPDNPQRSASLMGASLALAGRVVRELFRAPQLLATTLGQGVLFLLVFRYVFGGAIATGQASYVAYLAPGIITAGVIFAATGASVAVAHDRATGLTDLFATYPVPRLGMALGRVLADTVMVYLAVVVLIVVAVAVGFRPSATAPNLLAAAALLVLYAATYAAAFGALGSLAGGPQAAQGLSFLAVPLTFVSSAYVPVDSMPSWLAWFARRQPVTIKVEALRALSHQSGDMTAVVQAVLVASTMLVAALTTMLLTDNPRRDRPNTR